ncbi:MAG: RidA family protein [Caldilinea sp.]|nr:RidA family protein [Caldilinea sp.]MCB9118036.1 RidA family protein [Caldilineaceae bacterium]MCB9119765.1 RidA family protein [Caldilineaceae bacterium]MCO5211440.1 RidA family protein [Caldilinea sp.]MCW5842856.1 RidA family protein [Caldilinea sp.]
MSKRTVVSTPNAPAAIGPYSQAIRAGQFLFASGQLGLDPATGDLREGIEAQTRQALANLQAVLSEAGATVANVVKTTIFLADLSHFATVNQLYGEVFGHEPPARSTVQVAALPKGGLVEIEVIALLGD